MDNLIPEDVTTVTMPALEALDQLIKITAGEHGGSTYSPVNSINNLFSLPWNEYGPDLVNDQLKHIEKLIKSDPPLVVKDAAERLYIALSDMKPVYMEWLNIKSLSFHLFDQEQTA